MCVFVCVQRVESNLNERVNYLVDKPSPFSERLCLCIMWPKVNRECVYVLLYFRLYASVSFLFKSHDLTLLCIN